MVDVNGEDARYSVEGNLITMSVEYMYSATHGEYGISTSHQKEIFNEYTSVEEWNKAAQEYREQTGGEGLQMEFKSEVTELDDAQMGKYIRTEESVPRGKNLVLMSPRYKTSSLFNGNILRIKEIPRGYKTINRPHSHEFGHTVGLHHNAPTGSEKQRGSTNVMGDHPERRPPSAEDIKRLIKLIQILMARGNSNSGIIRGASNARPAQRR